MPSIGSVLPGYLMQNLHLYVYEQFAVSLDRTWNYRRVSSPFNRLYVVTAGGGTITQDGRATRLEPGCAYLLPLHATYDLVCPERMDKFYAHFRLELYERDLFAQSRAVRSVRLPEGRAERMTALAHSEAIDDCLELRALYFSVLAAWVSIPGKELVMSRRIAEKYAPFFALLRGACRAGLTVAEFADAVHLAPVTFAKTFRRDTGMTVKRYYEGRLAQRACEELVLSGSRINEVAARLRFSDEFYFSRFFKKMTGVSPREYRKRNKI